MFQYSFGKVVFPLCQLPKNNKGESSLQITDIYRRNNWCYITTADKLYRTEKKGGGILRVSMPKIF